MKVFEPIATTKKSLPPNVRWLNRLLWLGVALVIAIALVWLPYLLRSNDFQLPVLDNIHKPLQTSGLYPTEQSNQGVLRWTEPTATINLPSTLIPQQINLKLATTSDIHTTAQIFYDNQQIGSLKISAQIKEYQLSIPKDWEWQGSTLEIKVSQSLPATKIYTNGQGVELFALSETAASAPPVSIWLAICLLVISLFWAGLQLLPNLIDALDNQILSRSFLGFVFLVNMPTLLLTLYWNFDRIQVAATLGLFTLAAAWIFLLTLATPWFATWPKLWQNLILVGLPLILLVIGVAWLYGQIFAANYGFYWDDYHIARPWTINQLTGVFVGTWDPLHFEPEYYRPITALSFALDYTLWGLNSFGYHLTNLLLQVGVVLAGYWLLRRLAVERTLAFVISGLAFLLPTSADATVWISERSDSLALLFMLLGLVAFSYFWQNYVTENKNQKSWGKAFILANLTFVLALGSKETGIILPEIWLLWAWIYSSQKFTPRQLLAWIIPAVTTVLYLILRSLVIQSASQSVTLQNLWNGYVSAVTQSCWGFNAVLGDVGKTPTLLQSLVVLALLVIMLGYLLWRGRELSKEQPKNLTSSWKLALFGLGWLLLSCAPLAPLATTYGIDRRVLYASGFGYALLIGGFLVSAFNLLQLRKKQWQLWPALAILVVVSWLIFSPLVQQNQQAQENYSPYSLETLKWDLWILHNPAWVKQIPATQVEFIQRKLKQARQIN